LRYACLALALVALTPTTVGAVTARDLSGRIRVDGYTNDFEADEVLFGFNEARQLPEEPATDSKWGPDNDINQIRVTWDKDSLYLAAEGVISGNNLVVLLDVLPDQGLVTMRNLNSWSRNFSFDVAAIAPDLFGATWDTNTQPRLLIHRGGLQVDDQQSGTLFRSAATFSTSQRGRAMEMAIPWNSLFLGSEGHGTRDTVMTVAGVADTFHLFPPGARIRIVGVVTSGGDNTGGPDSAPDNTRGHSQDGSQEVVIDNYAMVDLDRADDTGAGHGGPDGVADWNVAVKPRVTFRFQPPLVASAIDLVAVRFDRPAFAPTRGEKARFTFELAPRLDPADPVNQPRTVTFSAEIYDLHGRLVKTLYTDQPRCAVDPSDPCRSGPGPCLLVTDGRCRDEWNGRDAQGMLVEPGVYVLRAILEPDARRVTRSIVVVR
jgi:hypothetical protein